MNQGYGTGAKPCVDFAEWIPCSPVIPCSDLKVPPPREAVTTCKYGPWGYGTCACGSGTRVRSRSVIARPAGTVCGATVEVVECGSEDTCPDHCVGGEGSEWSGCSATCGSGFEVRQMRFGDRSCPPQAALKNCTAAQECGDALVDSQSAAQHCRVSRWQASGECVGGADPCAGTQLMYRQVEEVPLGEHAFPCETEMWKLSSCVSSPSKCTPDVVVPSLPPPCCSGR